MTQEQKDLLVRDLCGRLSHGVKCRILGTTEVKILGSIQYDGENTLFDFWEDDQKIQYGYQLYLSGFRPYLFPLSSMTEEQLYNNPIGFVQMGTIKADRDWGNITINRRAYYKLVDWFNKNHFDYRGLIPMGLAIDATGLNIY